MPGALALVSAATAASCPFFFFFALVEVAAPAAPPLAFRFGGMVLSWQCLLRRNATLTSSACSRSTAPMEGPRCFERYSGGGWVGSKELARITNLERAGGVR